MSYEIIFSNRFIKELKNIHKKYNSIKSDVADLMDILEIDPERGTPMGRGIYKIRLRISSKGKGKSGGGRLIYYFKLKDNRVLFLSIYDKSEQSDIPKSKLAKILKEEGLA